MNLLKLSLMTSAIIVIASSGSAQDFNVSPSHGSIDLNAGFAMDPHRIPIGFGGSIDASSLSPECVGYIANAPNLRLNYSGGEPPLIIRVESAADTTLVIRLPDGSWDCDDDSANGFSPELGYGDPMDGQYNIWIGTYSTDETNSTEPAELVFTETAATPIQPD